MADRYSKEGASGTQGTGGSLGSEGSGDGYMKSRFRSLRPADRPAPPTAEEQEHTRRRERFASRRARRKQEYGDR